MKKILIVEDELALLYALASQFDKKEFKVLQAVDGEEGLKTALKSHPDLILLDLLMPKMDGMSMLKELRKDSWGKGVKVIILTNLSDAEKIDEALKQGTYDYLVKKDWNISEVIEKVKASLGMK
ncbi:MAG: hypothetical protein A2563_03940 [Candidatus Magasanikbacteria bacterium RIFOXYD1_FULL_40_23]|uniref:Response regulatory domain-containing protein n=1 Tax=Candidatus Magasanikbacteria bacterium RIFOXYD1_FULL_40_23 TaxID=1798705 RepID=A0A1F6P9E6_9BACT|nr:MAG: hypothetical protein A2563_03940 [Candidatus Magasanikbacteria bacterium RIFOXYD1_FULL_40_23]